MKTLRRAFPIIAVLGSLSLVGTLIGLNAGNARGFHLDHKADGEIIRNHSYTFGESDGTVYNDFTYNGSKTLDSGSALDISLTSDNVLIKAKSKSGYFANFEGNSNEVTRITGVFSLFSGVSNPAVQIAGQTHQTYEGPNTSMGGSHLFVPGGEAFGPTQVVFAQQQTGDWVVTLHITGYSSFRIESLTVSYSCGA